MRGNGMTATSTYVLPNDWEHARRRLRLLETSFDPTTTRHLAGLGVGPGWRCLEVGAGGGSITAWLCRAAGPTGRVVAVDLDTRFVDELDYDNLAVCRLDVVNDDLPRGPFDLIHTRAVLVHIPERDEVLARLVSCLRPGGWLLVEEPDNALQLELASGLYHKVWSFVVAALDAVGVADDWARQLPSLFQAHGLTGIRAECHAPYFTGGSTLAQFVRVSINQLSERLLTHGATPELLDEMDSQLADLVRWFPGIPFVTAWGRRPG